MQFGLQCSRQHLQDDSLAIWDGQSRVGYPLLSSLSGSDLPALQISTLQDLFIVMSSDGTEGIQDTISATVSCPGGGVQRPCELCSLGSYDHDVRASHSLLDGGRYHLCLACWLPHRIALVDGPVGQPCWMAVPAA